MMEKFWTVLAALCTLLTLLPLVAILGYVGMEGFQLLSLNLFTQLPPAAGQEGGGIGNAIVGTLLVVGIATLLSVPIGVLAGISLSEFGEKSPLTHWFRLATNVLSGIPSILAGVFAYGLLVASGVLGFSAVAGGVALSVLMIPTIVRTTEEALKAVPQDLRWAAVSVGASPSQTVLRIVLPSALPAIGTGISLAIARAAGETAPLLYTALNSSLWPQGPLQPTPTLAVLIYNFSTSPFSHQKALAWAASLILVLLVLITSGLARWLIRQFP